jgi:putative methylase
MVRTRRELSIFLSHLKVFDKPNVRLEQYPSDGNTAGNLLWKAALNGDIDGKVCIDLGAGTGILGIGCLLLGAKHVFFVDIDPHIQYLLKKNIEFLDEHYEFPGTWEFVCSDVKSFQLPEPYNSPEQRVQITVVSNPPFGTKIKHADKMFLEKGISLSDAVYSMHKTSTKAFLEAFERSHNLHANYEDVSFPLHNTMDLHKKKIGRIEVTLVTYRKV